MGGYLLLPFVFSTLVNGLISDNATNSQCPFRLTFTAIKDVAEGSYVELSWPYPIVIEELHLNALLCSNMAEIGRSIFSIEYIDGSDTIGHTLLYDEAIKVNVLKDYTTLAIEFSPALYTKRIVIRSSESISCSVFEAKGCSTSSMCSNDESPCGDGGKCIGDGRCTCPIGRFGENCEKNITEVTFDDFEPIVLLNNILYTKSSQFEVIGNVSVVPKDDLHQRRTLGLILSLLFHGGHIHSHPGQNHHPSPHNTIHGHHSSGSPLSAFSHLLGGFSHGCNVKFGCAHNHHSPHYFFSTHGSSHHSLGASLSLSGHSLHLHVHLGHRHFYAKTSFFPICGTSYHIGSSFSTQHGATIFVNGNLVGSQTKPSTSQHGPGTHQQPLCMGMCATFGTHGHHGHHHHVHMSNINVLGASVFTLAANARLGLLGLAFLNFLKPQPPHTSFAWQHPQLTMASTIPTIAHSQSTIGQQNVFTPAVSTPITKLTTTTTNPTTTTKATTTSLPAATATSQGTVVATSSNATSNGPICYECYGHQSSDGACRNIAQCGKTDVCAAFLDTSGYVHRCMDQQLCVTSQTTTANTCWYCCAANLCNTRCLSGSSLFGPLSAVTTTIPTNTATTTTPVCQDTNQCMQLRLSGYDVCKDAIVSTSLCQFYCKNCPTSG